MVLACVLHPVTKDTNADKFCVRAPKTQEISQHRERGSKTPSAASDEKCELGDAAE